MDNHRSGSPCSNLDLYNTLFSNVRKRSTGPGGLHNIGNLVALFGGFGVFCLSQGTFQGDEPLVWRYLFGSAEISCLTVSMLIFLAGGEAYHRGFNGRRYPSEKHIRIGDFLSGVATVVLTISLVQFGEARFAIVAGCLLAVGKFGSATFPIQCAENHSCSGVQYVFRMMAIVSRIPSLATVGITLYYYVFSGGDETDAMLAFIMLISYLLWLSGDYLLIRAPSFREIEALK
ncbi:MAG: hypothetical protein ABJ246_00810 [Paracoccaceae bacterium]